MKTVPLGDVADIERASVKADAIRDGETYVGLENITNLGGFTGVCPVNAGDLKSTKFHFDEGHVLYGKLGTRLAKIAAPYFSGVCSTDILPVRPSAALDRRYLLHYLRLPAIIEFASRQVLGATHPRLSPKSLLKFPIPLPPVEEQRRIAGILDSADALRSKCRQALAKLDTIPQAIFIDMFGDPMKTVPLGDIAEVVSGGTPKRAEASFFGGDIPWVKIGDMLQGTVTSTEESITPAGLSRSSAKLLPTGTLLVSIFATIGRTAVLGLDAATNQAIAGLKIKDPSQVDNNYLRRYLESASEGLASQGRGVAQVNINLSILRSHMVPLPPIEEQVEFADLERRVQAAGEPLRQQAALLDELFASMQQRAFRGDL